MADDGFLELPRGIRIPLAEIALEAVRGGGPGGQNVNKVSTKVTARFDLRGSPSLPEDVRTRLLAKLASRLTTEGHLILHASEHRQQQRNREAVLARLRTLLAEALHVPRARRATRPTRGSVERRIQASKRRGEIKKLRRRPRLDD